MLFAPFLVVVVLAAGWSALWFYAAGRAEADLAAWRESERQAGRTQHCASQSIGGYPFRIEVRCGGASFDYVTWKCACGVDLYHPTNSMTCLIWKAGGDVPATSGPITNR